MSEFPWFRFYNETLSDRKILRICRDSGQPKALVIGVWATLLTLASESPERGALMISDGLYLTPEEIRDETGLDRETFDAITDRLTAYGLLDTNGEYWTICNWSKRQPNSDSSTERVRKHRQKKHDETLLKRFSNVIDKDKDKDKEGDQNAREATPQPVVVSSPFPVKVKSQPADRTPGGNGYQPPLEPDPIKTTREPTPEQAAIGEMANAITAVSGVSARLNWVEVGGLAQELIANGYTPEQVRTHYGRDQTPGAWNWYSDYWLGKPPKNERPSLKAIRETIAGATVPLASPTKKRVDPILRALATFGAQPVTQEAS